MSLSHQVTQCSSCSAPIVFLRTSKGNAMPVDADSVSPADDLFDSKKHVSHFATCPQAQQHRKAR